MERAGGGGTAHDCEDWVCESGARRFRCVQAWTSAARWGSCARMAGGLRVGRGFGAVRARWPGLAQGERGRGIFAGGGEGVCDVEPRGGAPSVGGCAREAALCEALERLEACGAGGVWSSCFAFTPRTCVLRPRRTVRWSRRPRGGGCMEGRCARGAALLARGRR